MNFELFVPTYKGLNNENSYTIQASTKKTGYFTGRISFNGGMRDTLDLTKYDYIELYTDKGNKLIAIRPTNTKSDSTRSIRKNGNLRFITCSSWLHVAVNELGYPAKGNGGYEQLKDGLIVLYKPEEKQ